MIQKDKKRKKRVKSNTKMNWKRGIAKNKKRMEGEKERERQTYRQKDERRQTDEANRSAI